MPSQSPASSPKPVATGTAAPPQAPAAPTTNPAPVVSTPPAPDLPKVDLEPSSVALSSRNFWLVAVVSTVVILAMIATVVWLYVTIFGSPV